MPNSVAQRIGTNTRLNYAKEGTRGSDSGITSGVVVPLRAESGFRFERAESEVPYFNGTGQGGDSAPEIITAQGPVPCSLEFTTSGNFFLMPHGASGYRKVALVTGYMHAFFPPTGVITPISGQLQNEYRESTIQYERARYSMLRSFALGYANGGAAPIDLDFVASGDIADTDLGATWADNGVNGVSVFNGLARIATAALAPTWLTLAGIKGFRAMCSTGAVAEPVAFNDGVAGSVNSFEPQLRGNLELMIANSGSGAELNQTFRDYAKNRTLMAYDCVWADATVGASPYPDKWIQLTIATMRFGRSSLVPGGRMGKTLNQPWMHVLNSTYSKIPGAAFGTVKGTYNVTASNRVTTWKADGGSNITVNLTTGATQTAAQVVTDLNNDGTFAASLVADVFNGRVRVTSKQGGGTGASSSVQFVTGVANGAETLLGFNNTAIAGFDSPYVIREYNLQSADY